MNNLEPFVNKLEALLKKLAPAARRKLANNIAKVERKRNQNRIRAQQDPDGGAFTPRQPVSEGVSFVVIGETFTYGGHQHRYKTMKDLGDSVVGFDEVDNAVRRYKKSHITPPVGANWGKLAGKTGKKKAMFRKIRLARYLKIMATSDRATIYFTGVAAGIAPRHHLGQDKLPPRELLGITAQDREEIKNIIIALLAKDL